MVGDLSVPGGQLAFEHDPAGLDTMTAAARQIPAMRKYTSLWKGGLGDPPSWLAGHGWRPEFHGLAALGRSYRARSRTRPAAVSHRGAGGLGRAGKFAAGAGVSPAVLDGSVARRQRNRSPAAKSSPGSRSITSRSGGISASSCRHRHFSPGSMPSIVSPSRMTSPRSKT